MLCFEGCHPFSPPSATMERRILFLLFVELAFGGHVFCLLFTRCCQYQCFWIANSCLPADLGSHKTRRLGNCRFYQNTPYAAKWFVLAMWSQNYPTCRRTNAAHQALQTRQSSRWTRLWWDCMSNQKVNKGAVFCSLVLWYFFGFNSSPSAAVLRHPAMLPVISRHCVLSGTDVDTQTEEQPRMSSMKLPEPSCRRKVGQINQARQIDFERKKTRREYICFVLYDKWCSRPGPCQPLIELKEQQETCQEFPSSCIHLLWTSVLHRGWFVIPINAFAPNPAHLSCRSLSGDIFVC